MKFRKQLDGSYSFIRLFWIVRNLSGFFTVSIYSFVFNSSFRSQLLSEELRYDRAEYLNKILASRAFKFLKLYWNSKDFVKTIVNKPLEVTKTQMLWKEIREKDRLYDREGYLTAILESKLFILVRIYWPFKNLLKLGYVFRNDKPSEFDKKMKYVLELRKIPKEPRKPQLPIQKP